MTDNEYNNTLHTVMRMRESACALPTSSKIPELLLFLPSCGSLTNVSFLQVRGDIILRRRLLSLWSGVGIHSLCDLGYF